jgi:hypothetical protein
MDDKMTFRNHYFQALGIRIDEELKEELKLELEAARKLAHDIRQFEIELYWKRATYFWAFQLIAFTTLGLLFKDGNIGGLGKLSLGRLLIPAPIGVITALAGYLTARGSKFWQENWEAHVDLLEDETKKRLTHVILCRRAPQFSVSRINQCLLGSLTFGWTAVLIVGAIPKAAEYLKTCSPWLGGIALFITLVSALFLFGTRSDFSGCAYYFGDETSWTDYPPKRRKTLKEFLFGKASRPFFIIWRDRSAQDVTVEQTPTPAASGPDNQPTPRRVS